MPAKIESREFKDPFVELPLFIRDNKTVLDRAQGRIARRDRDAVVTQLQMLDGGLQRGVESLASKANSVAADAFGHYCKSMSEGVELYSRILNNRSNVIVYDASHVTWIGRAWYRILSALSYVTGGKVYVALQHAPLNIETVRKAIHDAEQALKGKNPPSDLPRPEEPAVSPPLTVLPNREESRSVPSPHLEGAAASQDPLCVEEEIVEEEEEREESLHSSQQGDDVASLPDLLRSTSEPLRSFHEDESRKSPVASPRLDATPELEDSVVEEKQPEETVVVAATGSNSVEDESKRSPIASPRLGAALAPEDLLVAEEKKPEETVVVAAAGSSSGEDESKKSPVASPRLGASPAPEDLLVAEEKKPKETVVVAAAGSSSGEDESKKSPVASPRLGASPAPEDLTVEEKQPQFIEEEDEEEVGENRFSFHQEDDFGEAGGDEEFANPPQVVQVDTEGASFIGRKDEEEYLPTPVSSPRLEEDALIATTSSAPKESPAEEKVVATVTGKSPGEESVVLPESKQSPVSSPRLEAAAAPQGFQPSDLDPLHAAAGAGQFKPEAVSEQQKSLDQVVTEQLALQRVMAQRDQQCKGLSVEVNKTRELQSWGKENKDFCTKIPRDFRKKVVLITRKEVGCYALQVGWGVTGKQYTLVLDGQRFALTDFRGSSTEFGTWEEAIRSLNGTLPSAVQLPS
jgi:hypothetical protein